MKKVAYERMAAFFIFLFVLVFIITIIELCHHFGSDCGIPLHLWLDIYFIIVFIRYIIFDWFDILIVGYKPFWKFDWEIIKIIVILTALVAWLIYGYVIYFSDENNC